MRMHQVVSAAGIVALAAWSALLNLGSGAAAATEASRVRRGVTTVDVVIATGEVGDRDLARGIYIYHLKCAGSCELSRISLNQCAKTNHGDSAFIPRVDSWIGSQWISARQTDNRIELTVYQAFERGLPANMSWTFDSSEGPLRMLKELKTSGFIDYSKFPEKMVPLEFEPIARDRLKNLDCPVMLNGLAR